MTRLRAPGVVALLILTSSCWWLFRRPRPWPLPGRPAQCPVIDALPRSGHLMRPGAGDGSEPLAAAGAFGKVTFTSTSVSAEHRVWVWIVSRNVRRTVAVFVGDRRVFGSYFYLAGVDDQVEVDVARCDRGRWIPVRPAATAVTADGGRVSWAVTADGAQVSIQHGDGVRHEVEEDAVRRFAPVVRLHRDEQFFPANVHWYLSRVRMRQHRSVLRCRRVLLLLPFCSPIAPDVQLLDLGQVTPGSLIAQQSRGQRSGVGRRKTDFFLEIWGSDALQRETQRGALDQAVVYAHLRPAPGGSPNYDIQYWFFYPFNGSIARFPPLYQPQHEGDWEHVTVRVTPDFLAIDSVFFASHKDNQGWRPAADVIFDGTHPRVYSALHSHASYARAGTHARRNLPDDHTTEDGPVWEAWQRVVIVGEPERPTPGNEWLRYNGRWGQLGVAVIGGLTVTDGPVGPAMQRWWYDDNTPP